MDTPILPKPTPFDYHPPPMNSRSLLIFELFADISDQALESCLYQALFHVQSCFPLTQMSIVYEDDGQICYAPAPKRDESQHLVTNDNEFPSFAELKELGAPINMMKDGLAPGLKFAQGKGPHPILDLKATRIQGGLILCFLFAHQAVDGTAMAIIMRTFSMRCRECFSNRNRRKEASDVQFDSLLTTHNHTLARERLHALCFNSDSDEDITFLPTPYRLKPAQSPIEVPSKSTKPTLCIFKISRENIKRLKSSASPTNRQNAQTSWISTNDAVSALIMRCITRARQIPPSRDTINAYITVNARSKLSPPIPEDYMGNCVINTVAPLPVPQLLSDNASLSSIAIHIRHAISSLTSTHVSNIGSWINAQPDHRNIDFEWSYYGDKQDYGLISWAGWGLYDLDFGFGFPAFVRQCVSAWSNSCRIMPLMRDGTQEIVIGLEAVDMKRLRDDEVWRQWTEEVAV